MVEITLQTLTLFPRAPGIEVLQEQSMMCALAGVKVLSSRPPHASQYFREILVNRKVTVKAYSISPTTSDLLVDLVTPELHSVRQNILLHQVLGEEGRGGGEGERRRGGERG